MFSAEQLNCTTTYPDVEHTATIIFFHGSGGTGNTMKEWYHLMIKDFKFPYVKVLFPTAPLQPYTPAGGAMSNVWFDREDINPDVPEKLESLKDIEERVKELLRQENAAGIPSNRIIVGGFSMGGAVALHTAYRWDRELAGAFAFSSFLNKDSAVYKDLRGYNGRLPPLRQMHGDSDELVDLQWGRDTFDQLRQLGVDGDFQVFRGLGHTLNREGMRAFQAWAEDIFDPICI